MNVREFLNYLRIGTFLDPPNPKKLFCESDNELEKAIGRYLKFAEGTSGEKSGEEVWRCKCTDEEIKIKRWLFFYIDAPFQETPLIFIGGRIKGKKKKERIFISPFYANFLLYDLGFFIAVRNPREKFHLVWTDRDNPMEGVDEGKVTRWWFTNPIYTQREFKDFYEELKSRLLDEIANLKGRVFHFEDERKVYESVFEVGNKDKIKRVVEYRNVTDNPIGEAENILKCNTLKNPRIFIVDILWKGAERHGLDFIRHIRRSSRDWSFPPPIFVYTGYPYPQLVSQCFRLGVDFVVFKRDHDSANTKSSVTLLWLILWYSEVIKLLYEHVMALDNLWKLEDQRKGRAKLSNIQNCISRWLGVENSIWQSENYGDLVNLTPNRMELDKLPFSLRMYFPHLFRFVHATRWKIEFPEVLRKLREDEKELKRKAYGIHDTKVRG
jgi:CheY-like chemotaxis protein